MHVKDDKLTRVDPMKKKKNASGFTLLELLIAITILLLGLSAIYRLNDNSRIASAGAEELALVQLACQTKMNELLATKVRPIPTGPAVSIQGIDGWQMKVTTFSLNRRGIYGVRIAATKLGTVPADPDGNYELVRWVLE